MISLSGFREITVLKLPLVPKTHPRVWKSRPISLKTRATAGNVRFGVNGVYCIAALEFDTQPPDKPNGWCLERLGW